MQSFSQRMIAFLFRYFSRKKKQTTKTFHPKGKRVQTLGFFISYQYSSKTTVKIYGRKKSQFYYTVPSLTNVPIKLIRLHISKGFGFISGTFTVFRNHQVPLPSCFTVSGYFNFNYTRIFSSVFGFYLPPWDWERCKTLTSRKSVLFIFSIYFGLIKRAKTKHSHEHGIY